MERRSYAPVFDARTIAEYAVFIAIILMMRVTGLSRIPVGPLVMTLTMVPIAIGAMLLGPLGGAILGMVFGFTSLYDAMTGASAMTGFFFQVSPFHTVVLCVVTRTLVGAVTGWLFQLLRKLDRQRIWCYFAGGLLAPMLNTIFFMGYIVLVFYQTEYVQKTAAKLGAVNPLMFVILLVGLQGLVEWLTGCVIGGGVAKAVARALKRDGREPAKDARLLPAEGAPENEEAQK
jgi:uncharacterized membrane protein